jgi:hypothetical protein
MKSKSYIDIMENMVKIIVWFFIITGAIVVTKISLFNIDTNDNTSIFLGLALINIVWITIGVELEKVVKNFKK